MKICPKCSINHERPGKFCSRKCANSRGPRTEEFKNTIRTKLTGRILRKDHIDKIIESRRTSNPLYASHETRKCIVCNSSFETTYLANSKTCRSKECIRETQVSAGRKSAQSRATRSKDEIALFELCKNKFPTAKSNSIIAEGWDADIVIADKKVAILWNGPWHYRDMKMSNHSLSQVQNRDKIKTELFKSLGWKVIVFEDRYYTPTSAFEIIIKEIS